MTTICHYCGGPVIFRTNADGSRYPIHTAGPCEEGVLLVTRGPTSFPTSCPICSNSVFFVRHNNGSVWLDALGPPWPIHGCFAKITTQNRCLEIFKDWEALLPGFQLAVVDEVLQRSPWFVIRTKCGDENLAGYLLPFSGGHVHEVVGKFFDEIRIEEIASEGAGSCEYREFEMVLPPELALLLKSMELTDLLTGQLRANVDSSPSGYEVFGFGQQDVVDIQAPELLSWAIEKSAQEFSEVVCSLLLEAIEQKSEGNPLEFLEKCGLSIFPNHLGGAIGAGGLLLVDGAEDRVFLEGIGMMKFLRVEFCPNCPQVFPVGNLDSDKTKAH